jgi:hypothetical protein
MRPSTHFEYAGRPELNPVLQVVYAQGIVDGWWGMRNEVHSWPQSDTHGESSLDFKTKVPTLCVTSTACGETAQVCQPSRRCSVVGAGSDCVAEPQDSTGVSVGVGTNFSGLLGLAGF